MKKDFKKLTELASVLSVQDDIKNKSLRNMDVLSNNISNLSNHVDNIIEDQNELLDLLDNINISDFDSVDKLNNMFDNLENTVTNKFEYTELEDIEYNIKIDASIDDIIESSIDYANKNDINIDNPFNTMLSNTELTHLAKDITEKYNLKDLDKDDIAFSAFAGIIAGIVDIVFVGEIKAKDTTGLQNYVDKKFETIITKYVKILSGKYMNHKDAVRYLEKYSRVSYDAATRDSVILDGLSEKNKELFKKLNPSNHHLKSLAHHPTPIGLIVGLIDQLTGKTTFILSGEIVRAATKNENKYLGNNLISKLIKGIFNWFNHVMSDISGSSTSKGRGQGLPAPGYMLFQKLQFGKIPINGNDKNIAELTEWMYLNGYDFRAFTTQMIPVMIYETLVRIYWFSKKFFYYGNSFKECLPIANEKNTDLTKMLLISAGSFSTLDLGDAFVKSGAGHDLGKFFMSINYPGLLDLGFRSYQSIRNNVKRNKQIKGILENQIYEIENLLK